MSNLLRADFLRANFLRAARLCLHRPATLGLAFACSLAVAGFWGANIGAVYPLMEVLFRNKSFTQWVDAEIADRRAAIAEAEQTTTRLQAQLPDLSKRERAAAEQKISLAQDRRAAEQRALQFRQRLRPMSSWLPQRAYPTLVVLMGALLLGTVLKNGFLMANAMLVERAVQSAMLRIRRKFFENALRLDLASLGETGSAELTSRFAYDMESLTLALRNVFAKATVEPLKMVFCLIAAGMFSWRLLVFSLLLAPLAGWLIGRLAKAIKRANRRGMEEMSRLVGQLSESIEAVQIVKAFAMEKHEQSRFAERATAYYRKSIKIIFYNALTKPVTEMFGVGVVSLALVTGGYLVLAQETHLLGVRITDTPLSPEAFFAFFALLAGAADPARKLADIFAMIQPGWPAADRVFAVIDRRSAIEDPPQPKKVSTPHRMLTFESVSFHYHPGQEVLRGVSVQIPFGQSLAIVGPNGCGKSTLVNLAPRFHDPISGSVRLDEVDLREMRLDDVRGRIGLVSQQARLFDDTIANNIRYGSPDASDDEVRRAAERAHAHRFITDKLDNGYDTIVGTGGGKLSGGQRQRIALARAILRDPEILILDEATSQVDIESERLIHEALTKFIRGRTAIMITHRLSTLALAERILVMEAGRVLDIGTHDQLLTRCPSYQRLHAIELRKSA